ncbi:hypothetical protein B0H13DRAFT_2293779 [Mycena leptocephala]|nr:hypothetical protein B0H13DRAFT_2293779 [Mycena leptocephala]
MYLCWMKDCWSAQWLVLPRGVSGRVSVQIWEFDGSSIPLDNLDWARCTSMKIEQYRRKSSANELISAVSSTRAAYYTILHAIAILPYTPQCNLYPTPDPPRPCVMEDAAASEYDKKDAHWTSCEQTVQDRMNRGHTKRRNRKDKTRLGLYEHGNATWDSACTCIDMAWRLSAEAWRKLARSLRRGTMIRWGKMCTVVQRARRGAGGKVGGGGRRERSISKSDIVRLVFIEGKDAPMTQSLRTSAKSTTWSKLQKDCRDQTPGTPRNSSILLDFLNIARSSSICLAGFFTGLEKRCPSTKSLPAQYTRRLQCGAISVTIGIA